MAESYSDDHVLAMYIGALAEDDRVWVKTARRLMRERDEAQRVARSVASDWMTYLMNGTLRDPAPDVDTALAYPDRGGQ